MTLTEMLRAVWRRKVLVMLSLVAGAGIAAGLVLSRAHQYQSVAEIVLTASKTAQGGAEGQATNGELILQAVTDAQLVGVPGFVEKAASAAGIQVGDATVTGATPVNTTLLSITVTSTSRANVAPLASAVVDLLRSDYTSASATTNDLGVVEVQQPTTVALSRNGALTFGVALAAAAAVGITLAILLDTP